MTLLLFQKLLNQGKNHSQHCTENKKAHSPSKTECCLGQFHGNKQFCCWTSCLFFKTIFFCKIKELVPQFAINETNWRTSFICNLSGLVSAIVTQGINVDMVCVSPCQLHSKQSQLAHDCCSSHRACYAFIASNLMLPATDGCSAAHCPWQSFDPLIKSKWWKSRNPGKPGLSRSKTGLWMS